MEQFEGTGYHDTNVSADYVCSSCDNCTISDMFVALGEEVGWRGALYPYLKKKFGDTKGRIVGGAIWGAWQLADHDFCRL